MFTLNIIIDGQKKSDTLTINVSCEDKFLNVAEQILRLMRSRLQKTHPSMLEIWRVSIPLYDNSDEHVHLSDSGTSTLSQNWEPLAEVYPERPPYDEIHLLIKPPPATST